MKTRAKLWLLGLALGLMVPGAAAFAQTTVSLTFDDGLSYDPNIPPILDPYGMKGTFYIISGFINDSSNSNPDYMTLDQIKALQADGHEIGGHTITHLDLYPPTGTKPTAAQQQHEVCDGRAQLIGMGLSPVVSFAYPSGDASATTEAIVKGCGFTSGRGAWCNYPIADGTCLESIPPPNTGDVNDNPYWIQTEEAVQKTTTLANLQTYVTDAEATGTGWVILQFHFICPDANATCNADQYSMKSSTFTAFVNWLQGQVSSGTVVVKTMGQVMGGFPSSTPIPAILSVSPSTVTVLGSSFTLTVNGVNFASGATLNWNATSITPTTVSATQITAPIPASYIATLQVTTLSVTNPGPVTSPGTLLNLVNPVPVLTTLSSTYTVVGSTGITLTVTGSNFVPTSVVRWNGAARTTTFVSSTTISAVIPSTDLSTVKIDSVTVFNPTPGGGVSASTQIFTVVYPLPALTSLSPNSAVVGSSTVTLTLTGTNFVSSSTVRWNGAVISTTTFVNSTTLRTQIPTSALATVTIASVNVFTPTPGGGTSSTQTFTVGNPVPVLTTLSPSSTIVSGPTFTLTLRGSNFVGSSVVQWAGQSDLTPTLVTATTIQVTVPASYIATTATPAITVFNPAPAGGASSAQTFTVGNPVPVITVLSSTAAVVGSPGFTLNVTGSNFVASSVVQWNNSSRTTTFFNSTSLSAVIPATDLAVTNLANVTVLNPAPGGGTSNTQPFAVGNPGPGIVALSPSFAVVGSAASTMTVTGLNFLNGLSIVQWNGLPRTTTFINNTTLTALILNSDLVSTGTASVTVFTSGLGGGVSNAQTFTIGYATPVLSSIDHPFVTAGGPSFTLTATGQFVSGSILEWNGSPLTMISASSTTLSATVPSSAILVEGNASVTVFTPAPGGGMSSPKIINISAASGGTASVNQVRVHPNPWRANLHAGHDITFDEMPADSTIKIFAASAHWVRTLTAPAGSATWDLKNDSGDNVASGYYIYLVTNPQGKSRGILAIIR